MQEDMLVETLKEAALHLYYYGSEKQSLHQQNCTDCQNDGKQRDRVTAEVTELLSTASSVIASAVSIAKNGLHGHPLILSDDTPDDSYKELATKWASEIIEALKIEPGAGN